MNMDELEVYRVAMEIGERVWGIVNTWNFFAKDTVGKQFVKAADSVAANISEGFGRFYYKENKQFGYYARGSLYETKTWLTKAHNRGLVDDAEYESLRSVFESISIRLNNYIRSIGTGATAVRETTEEYGAQEEEEEEVNGAGGASGGERVIGGCAVSGGGASLGANAPSMDLYDASRSEANDAAQPPMTLSPDAPPAPMTLNDGAPAPTDAPPAPLTRHRRQ